MAKNYSKDIIWTQMSTNRSLIKACTGLYDTNFNKCQSAPHTDQSTVKVWRRMPTCPCHCPRAWWGCRAAGCLAAGWLPQPSDNSPVPLAAVGSCKFKHTHSQYAMQNTRKTQHCCLVSTAYNTQRLSLEGCRCVLTGAYRQWGHWARCSVSQRCENEK